MTDKRIEAVFVGKADASVAQYGFQVILSDSTADMMSSAVKFRDGTNGYKGCML